MKKKGMKFGKKIVSMVLALAMTIPAMPAQSIFTEADTTALFTVSDNLFDQTKRYEDLGLNSIPGAEVITVFEPTATSDKFVNGVVMTEFDGKLYCQWQSSAESEDADDTWVAYSVSEDNGITWSEPKVLAATCENGYRSSGGWHVYDSDNDGRDDTIVAYINQWDNAFSHKGGSTYYTKSTDGVTWSSLEPVLMANGSQLNGIFEQDPHVLENGRIVNAAHFQAENVEGVTGGLVISPMYTDDQSGVTGWTKATTYTNYGTIKNDAKKSYSSTEIEPSMFVNEDGNLVMIFRDQNNSYNILASISEDNGETWRTLEETNMLDARQKQSAGNLPDGTAFIVNCPVDECNSTDATDVADKRVLRYPLVITLSANGKTFTKSYVIGKASELDKIEYNTDEIKRRGYHYPKSVVIGNYLYVSYAENKENVEFVRIPLESISLNGGWRESEKESSTTKYYAAYDMTYENENGYIISRRGLGKTKNSLGIDTSLSPYTYKTYVLNATDENTGNDPIKGEYVSDLNINAYKEGQAQNNYWSGTIEGENSDSSSDYVEIPKNAIWYIDGSNSGHIYCKVGDNDTKYYLYRNGTSIGIINDVSVASTWLFSWPTYEDGDDSTLDSYKRIYTIDTASNTTYYLSCAGNSTDTGTDFTLITPDENGVIANTASLGVYTLETTTTYTSLTGQLNYDIKVGTELSVDDIKSAAYLSTKAVNNKKSIVSQMDPTLLSNLSNVECVWENDELDIYTAGTYRLAVKYNGEDVGVITVNVEGPEWTKVSSSVTYTLAKTMEFDQPYIIGNWWDAIADPEKSQHILLTNDTDFTVSDTESGYVYPYTFNEDEETITANFENVSTNKIWKIDEQYRLYNSYDGVNKQYLVMDDTMDNNNSYKITLSGDGGSTWSIEPARDNEVLFSTIVNEKPVYLSATEGYVGKDADHNGTNYGLATLWAISGSDIYAYLSGKTTYTIDSGSTNDFISVIGNQAKVCVKEVTADGKETITDLALSNSDIDITWVDGGPISIGKVSYLGTALGNITVINKTNVDVSELDWVGVGTPSYTFETVNDISQIKEGEKYLIRENGTAKDTDLTTQKIALSVNGTSISTINTSIKTLISLSPTDGYYNAKIDNTTDASDIYDGDTIQDSALWMFKMVDSSTNQYKVYNASNSSLYLGLDSSVSIDQTPRKNLACVDSASDNVVTWALSQNTGSKEKWAFKRANYTTNQSIHVGNYETTTNNETTKEKVFYIINNKIQYVTLWRKVATYDNTAALSVPTTYTIEQNSISNEDLLSIIESNATVKYKNSSGNITDYQLNNTDYVNLSWNNTLDTSKTGTYELTVNYNNKGTLTKLGTITVNVVYPDEHLYHDVVNNDGTVASTEQVEGTTIDIVDYTGATDEYKLYLKDTFIEAVTEDVPNTVYKWSSSDPDVATVDGSGKVTFVGGIEKTESVVISVQIISDQSLDTEKEKTLSVTFNVKKSTDVHTPETNPESFPASGQPGNVSISKTAAGQNYDNTGVAELELSITGTPASKPLDVILVMDVSRSMVGLGKYISGEKEEQDSSDTGILNYNKLNFLRDSASDFVEKMLEINPQNRVALVQFADDGYNSDENRYYEINSRVISYYEGVDMKDQLISLIKNGVDTKNTYVNDVYDADDLKDSVSHKTDWKITDSLNGAGDGYYRYSLSPDTNDLRYDEYKEYYGGTIPSYEQQETALKSAGLTLSNRGGTNYGLALQLAEKVVAADELEDDNREKIIVFMSDGGTSSMNLGSDSLFATGHTDTSGSTTEVSMDEVRQDDIYKLGSTERVIIGRNGASWSNFATKRDFVSKSRLEAQGYEILTLGYDLKNDNTDYFGIPCDDPDIIAAKKQVLKNLATYGEAGYYDASYENLSTVYADIKNDILHTATNTVVDDTIGDAFELRLLPYITNSSDGTTENAKIEIIEETIVDSEIHNFSSNGLISDFYTFKNGNVQLLDILEGENAGNNIVVNYNGTELKRGLKLWDQEDDTKDRNITFTPNYDGTFTMIFGDRGDISVGDPAVTINGVDYPYQQNADKHGGNFYIECPVTAATTVTVIKDVDAVEPYVYYLNYTPDKSKLENVVEEVIFEGSSYAGGITAKHYINGVEDTDFKLTISAAEGNINTYSITGQYFTYDVATKRFVYNVGTLTPNVKYRIRYDAYLKGSNIDYETAMGYVVNGVRPNERKEPNSGVLYPTNVKATANYDNVNDDACMQTYGIPEMPWSAGKITYKFYLAKATQDGTVVPIDSNAKIITGGVEDYVIVDSFSEVVDYDALKSNDGDSMSFTEAVKQSEEVTNGIGEIYDYIITDPNTGEPIGTYQVTVTYEGNNAIYNEEIIPNDGVDLGVLLEGDNTLTNTVVYFPITLVNIATNKSDAVVIDYGLNSYIDLLANDNFGGVLNNISLVSLRPLSETDGKLPEQSAILNDQLEDTERSSLNLNLEFVSDSEFDVSGNTAWRKNTDIINRFNNVADGRYLVNLNGSQMMSVEKAVKTKGQMLENEVFYVDKDILSNISSPDYTFSAWVKKWQSTGTIMYSEGNGRSLAIRMVHNDTDITDNTCKLDVEVKVDTYTGGDANTKKTIQYNMISKQTITYGQWAYIAVVYDNTTGLFKLYINGVQSSTDYVYQVDGVVDSTVYNVAIPTPFNSYDQKFYLGAKPEDELLLNGWVDSIKLYSAELSSDEISAIYNGTSDTYIKETWGYGTDGSESRSDGAYFKTGGNTYAKADGNYGLAQISQTDVKPWEQKNAHVNYYLNKMIDGADDFMYALRYDYKDNSESNYVYGTLKVLPANSVYYEDNFVGINYDKNTEVTGGAGTTGVKQYQTITSGTVKDTQDFQLADMQGDDVVYGYDSNYLDNSGFSNNTVTEMGSMAIAQFTFTGTGFDIFSRTNTNTDEILVIIDPEDDSIKTKMIARDLYFEDGDLYQIPVISVTDLAYGKYTVSIMARYAKNGRGDTTDNTTNQIFYLDGIRIYNPLNVNDTDTENAKLREQYYADGENNAKFTELRNELLGANKLQLVTYDGTNNVITSSDGYTTTEYLLDEEKNVNNKVYYTGANKTEQGMDDYLKRGPNNELYLSPGQAISFYVSEDAAVAEKTLQVGAKNPNTDSAEMTIKVGIGETASVKEIPVNTKSELYYEIVNNKTSLNDMTQIVIANTGTDSSGFISLTDLKINGYTISEIVEGNNEIAVANVNSVLSIYETELVLSESDVAVGGYTLSLDGDIAVNYYMNLSEEIRNDSGAYMKFTLADGTVENVPVSEAEERVVGDDIYYMFSCDVAAKEMNDVVKAQIVNGVGVASEEYSYSVKDYADYIMANEADYSAEIVELTKAMLNYGGYTQQLFGYNVENLANEGLNISVEDVTVGDEFEYELTGAVKGIEYYGASLVLKSETTVKYYFQLTGDKDISEYTFTCNGETLEPVESDACYYVEINDIAAKDLGNMYSIEVTDGTETMTVEFGPMTYAQQVLASDDQSEELKNVVRALYNYWKAAEQYFNTL